MKARQRFRPRLWSVIGTIALGAFFVGLGLWQLQRAAQKQALESGFESASQKQTKVLDVDAGPPGILEVTPAQVAGTYLPTQQLLLDHQTRNRIPGYHVWTPLQLPQGLIMVNRGWVEASPNRTRLPDIRVEAVARSVSGFWRPFPKPAYALESDPCAERNFPRVVSYPDHTELLCIYGQPLADGILLLAEEEPDGYIRDWKLPNPVPPARHYGYAAQWFAFAATLLFLFIKLNYKPDDSSL